MSSVLLAVGNNALSGLQALQHSLVPAVGRKLFCSILWAWVKANPSAFLNLEVFYNIFLLFQTEIAELPPGYDYIAGRWFVPWINRDALVTSGTFFGNISLVCVQCVRKWGHACQRCLWYELLLPCFRSCWSWCEWAQAKADRQQPPRVPKCRTSYVNIPPLFPLNTVRSCQVPPSCLGVFVCSWLHGWGFFGSTAIQNHLLL